MKTPFYQGLKRVLVRHIHFRPHDPFHIYIGFFAFLITAAWTKKGFSLPFCLLPGFVLSLLMEVFDLRDDYVYTGTPRWSDSAHGVVVTTLGKDGNPFHGMNCILAGIGIRSWRRTIYLSL